MGLLPGGFWDGLHCLRDYTFRSITGEMELALFEAIDLRESIPTRVTNVLLAAIESFGGRRPDHDIIHGLSVSDRQFLMRRLAIVLGYDGFWQTQLCDKCGESFDFHLENSGFPVSGAGVGYPFTTIETTCGDVKFRVPTGIDQDALCSIPGHIAPSDFLIDICSCEEKNHTFSDEDKRKIEDALESVSPGVVTEVVAHCPECNAEHMVNIDPYMLLHVGNSNNLFQDIHAIASHYHWSESDILSLSRQRREQYLNLIDNYSGENIE